MAMSLNPCVSWPTPMLSLAAAGGLALATVAGCCASTRLVPEPASGAGSGACGVATVRMDFAGVEAWLACHHQAGDDALDRCLQASAETVGGRLAGLAAGSFGDGAGPDLSARVEAVRELVESMRR